ncbi:MAG: AI-2E family transporter [Hyphomicrobiaceae bacterium]
MPMIASTVQSLAYTMIVSALFIVGLVYGQDLLIPLALATLLTFALSPIARFMERGRIPRVVAVGTVMTGIVAIVLLVTAVLSAELMSATETVAANKENVLAKIRIFTREDASNSMWSRAVRSVETLGEALSREFNGGVSATPMVVDQQSSNVGQQAISAIGSILQPLGVAGLTLLLTAIMLANRHDLTDRLLRVTGTDHITETTTALEESGERLSQLLLAQIGLNLCFGVVVSVALWMIGIPNAFLWGSLGILLRFIPFIGPVLASLPPLILAAAIDPGWATLLLTASLLAIGEFLTGQVLEPLVFGRSVGLSTFTMVLSAVFWTIIWGPIGLLLAAPLTMMLVTFGKFVPQLSFLSVLLGNEPPLDAEHSFYHRLMRSDVTAAAEVLSQATSSTPSPAESVHKIVMTSLRLAMSDFRLGRLEREDVKDIESTLIDASALYHDHPESTVPSSTPDARPRVLFVPLKAPIDLIACRYLADHGNREQLGPCAAVGMSSSSLALAGLVDDPQYADVETIVLCTVSDLTARQLDFLFRRAQREVSGPRLLFYDGSGGSTSTRDQTGSVTHVSSLGGLMSRLPMAGEHAASPAGDRQVA